MNRASSGDGLFANTANSAIYKVTKTPTSSPNSVSHHPSNGPTAAPSLLIDLKIEVPVIQV